MNKELVFKLTLAAVIGFLVYMYGVKPMLNPGSYHMLGKNRSWAKGKLVQEQGKYDVAVFGDEPEGVAAAVSAARAGAKTLLLYETGDLGGAVSRSLMVDLEISAGAKNEPLNRGFASELRDSFGSQFSINRYKNAVERIIKAERNLDVFFNARLESLVMEGSDLKGFTAFINNDKRVYAAKRFIDATKDGRMLAMAGVPYFSGAEDLNLKGAFSPVRLNFEMAGVKHADVSKLAGSKNPSFYGGIGKYEPSHINMKLSDVKVVAQEEDKVVIEGLEVFNLNLSDEKAVAAAYRDAVNEAKDFSAFLSKRFKEFKDAKFRRGAEAFYIKEYRHFKGEHVLSINEILENKDFIEKIALGSYPVRADKFTNKEDFIIGKPAIYSVPLGCLIPVKVDNLIMVGNKASYSSLASSSAGTLGVSLAGGEAAGTAAVYSIVKNITPRDILKKKEAGGISELQGILKKQGVYIDDFDIENKNSDNWSYAAVKQLNFLGLIAGGINNDYRFNTDARQQDLAILLVNGIYRLAPEKYSLELDARIRKFFVRDKLTREKAGEILTVLNSIKVVDGKYYQRACELGYINDLMKLRLKDKDILTMDDVYYIGSSSLRMFTGRNIGE